MQNTWPNGERHAMSQKAHEVWNGEHYPGTRQLCVHCNEPTGRCEEDAIYIELDAGNDCGPLCDDCYARTEGSE